MRELREAYDLPQTPLAPDPPDEYGQQAEAGENGPGPLEDRLLARGAEVECLLFLGLAARRLLGARGARRGLRGAVRDDGALDRRSRHDGRVVAAYHPPR